MISLNLESLDQLLSSKKIASVIGGSTFLIFIFSISFVIQILAIAAVIFSVYMLAVLFTEKKFGWIAGFAVLMGISWVPALIMTIDSTILDTLILYLPLFSFFLYCTVLKIQTTQWVQERDIKKEIFRKKWIQNQKRNV